MNLINLISAFLESYFQSPPCNNPQVDTYQYYLCLSIYVDSEFGSTLRLLQKSQDYQFNPLRGGITQATSWVAMSVNTCSTDVARSGWRNSN
jgi:hypothetical protein